MIAYISLLRGINVGGNKIIKMDALKALYQSLGFGEAQTLLQSGNVVFTAEQADASALAAQLEASILQTFGFESKIMLRTAAQWQAVVEAHPFTEAQLAEPSKILVAFLRAAPAQEAVDSLKTAHTGIEQIYVRGQEAYLFYPDGMGRSKLDNPTLERRLGVATGRNWNTVNKLAELVKL